MEEYGFQENKSQGFIKLYRSFTKWEWYDDANTMRVFLHCLLKANHESAKWRGNIIERGSFISSYGIIAKELRLSVQNIRTSIRKLNLTGELTYKTTSRYSIITINNYNVYQENNNQDNNLSTIKQQSINNQATTNKNDKNKKNKKNIQAKNLFLKFFEDDSSEFKEYESFKEIFIKWLDYKTAIKKQYRSEQGLKAAFEDLIRLSEKDVNSANELVEYAISKEWQGIYAIPKNVKKIKSVSGNKPKTDWESRLM